tara:strand:- start:498 stop:662 length:165 start_codon:yes stop_codon:yes gene_type:complete
MINFNEYDSQQLKSMIQSEVAMLQGYGRTYTIDQLAKAKADLKLKRDVIKSRQG